MRIPYYPGCSPKTSAKNFESSALAVAKALGVEMVELPKWNCCGAVFSLTSDDLMHHVAPLRNLIRVQEMNEKGIVHGENRLVTLCDMCYNTLKRSDLFVKENAERLEKINDFMDEEENYEGNVEVIHFLQLLKEVGFDKIGQSVKVPLTGLKVSPYYGCLMLRPREVAIDNPEKPTILADVLQAIGAEIIDNPYRSKCCGSYQTVNKKYVVAELAFEIIGGAREREADAMALSCPLCAFNLDNRQEEVQELHSASQKMPVFYFTQLMALAFGLDEESCGFDINHVDPRPLLIEKGLLKS